MTTITTVAELLALPEDAVLFHHEVGVVAAYGDNIFYATGDERPYEADEVIEWQPLTLIYMPTAGATRVMVRCCATDCVETAALRPGSTYLCPDHGDSTNTIIKGES